jgi:hypothetical protein
VFVPDLFRLKLLLISLLVDFLEDVLEPSVVLFQDSVLGCHVKRVFSLESELETTVGKVINALVDIVHTHPHTTLTFKLKHLHALLFSFIVLEYDFECSWSVDNEICRLVLIAKSVSANDDWLLPARDQSGNVLDNDWLSEHCSVKDVSDCTVG